MGKNNKSAKASALRAKLADDAAGKVEAARRAVDEADARLVAAAEKNDEEAKAAALRDRDAATADLERYQKAASLISGGGTMAEALIENGWGDNPVTVTVIGPAKGRRRAGYQFGANPVTIEVTLDQLKLIEGDAELAVTPGTGPVTLAGAVRDEVRIGTLRALRVEETPLAKPLFSIFSAGLSTTSPAAQFHAFLQGGRT